MSQFSRSHRSAIIRGVIAGALLAAVAACGNSTAPSQAASAPGAAVAGTTSTPVPAATPTQMPSPTATATPAPSPSETPEATGVATSIDPCQLYSAAEASQLTGATFGAGQESVTSGHGKLCTYGAQTLNVFEVVVAVAPDLATAQAERAAAEKEVQQKAPGVQFSKVPNLGDDAAVVSASFPIGGKTLAASGIYVLKGTIFFSLNDVSTGSPAPTPAALESAAQVVLGRLP